MEKVNKEEFYKKELELISSINNKINLDFNINELANHIVAEMKKDINFDGCNIALIDDNDFLQVIYDYNSNLENRISKEEMKFKWKISSEANWLCECASKKIEIYYPDLNSMIDEFPLLAQEIIKNKGFTGIYYIPLKLQDKVVGTLMFTSYKDKLYFSDFEKSIIRRRATFLARMIENANLYKQVEKQKQELNSLNSISMQMSSSLDFDQTFNKIVNYLTSKYDFESCTLALVLKDQNKFRIEKMELPDFLFDLKKSFLGTISDLIPENGYIANSILQNNILHISNIKPKNLETNIDKITVQLFKMKSLLAIPIEIANEIIGALSLSSHSKTIDISNQDIDAIKRFVNQVAVAIRNSKLYDDLQSKNKEINTLNELTKKISMSLNFEEVFDIVVDYLMKKYGFEGCSFQHLISNKKAYIIKFYKMPVKVKKFYEFFAHSEFPLDEKGGRIADCMLNNKTYYFTDIDPEKIKNTTNRKAIEALNIKTSLHVPTAIQDEVIGSFSFTTHSKPIYLDENDLKNINNFLTHIAAVVRNSKLYDELQSKNKEIYTLNELTKKISMSVNFEKVFDIVVDYLMNKYGFEGCSFQYLNPSKQAYIIEFYKMPVEVEKFYEFFAHSEFPLNEQGGRITDCMLNNKTYYFTDIDPEKIENITSRKAIEALNIKTSLHVPTAIQDEVIGSFSFTTHSKPIYLDDNDLKNINNFLTHIAAVVRNSRLYDSIKQANQEVIKLNQISKDISFSLDFKKTFNKISNYLFQTFGFESCIFNKVSQDRKFYSTDTIKFKGKMPNKYKSLLKLKFKLIEGENRIADCILKNKIYYFPEIKIDEIENENNRKAIIFLKIKSLIHLPIDTGKEVIGNFILCTHSKNIYLESGDIEKIKRFVNQIAILIKNSKLYEELNNQKIELENKEKIINEDLKLAKKIQSNFIPSPPKLNEIDIACKYLPMFEVGGDYYDFIIKQNDEENKLGVLITDASGHGVQAALITSMVKTTFDSKEITENMNYPDRVLKIINKTIIDKTAGNFVTAQYAVFDFMNKKLRICCGGHNPMIQLDKNNTLKEIHPKGRVLSLLDDIYFEIQEYNLEKGCRYIFYTDGLTEAVNEKNEDFEDIFKSLLVKHRKLSAQKSIDLIIKRVFKHVNKNNFDDDIAIIIIDIK